MGARFSKKEQNKKTQDDEFDQLIIDMKRARDRLIKQQKRLEEETDRQMKIIKDLLAAKKVDRAKIALKVKKNKEKMIGQLDGMLTNIQSQIDATENKRIEISVFEGMKEANALLKKLNEQMPIEEVEQLMDDTAEIQAQINEVTEALARDLTPAEQQLADEEAEELLNEILGVPAPKEAEPEPQPEQESDHYEEEEAPKRIAALA